MTFYKQSHRGCTNGQTLAAGSGATVDGSIQYDAVSIPTGATLAFDNTHTLFGTPGEVSVLFNTAATSGSTYVAWTTGITYGKPMCVSACFYFTANPASSFRLLEIMTSATLQVTLNLSSSGILSGFDNAGTGTGNMTNAIPLNQWFRVELKIIAFSATVAQFEYRLFSNATDVTPLETKTTTATFNTGLTTTPTQVRIGHAANNTASQANAWLAWPQVSDTTTYPPPPLTPVVPTRQTTWAALASIAPTRVTTWATLATVTLTRATTWTTRVGVGSSTRATTWAALAGVGTTSRSTTWGVAQGAAASRGTTWSTLARVTPTTRLTTWNVSLGAFTSRSTTWAIGSFINSSRTTTWAVLPHVFRPPTVKLGPADPLGERLWLYYGIDVGITVLKHFDGTYTQVQYPTSEEIEAAAIAYIGGHEYVVLDDEWAQLRAAGYGDGTYVDPSTPPDPIPVDPGGGGGGGGGGTPDPGTYGSGTYGSGIYGA